MLHKLRFTFTASVKVRETEKHGTYANSEKAEAERERTPDSAAVCTDFLLSWPRNFSLCLCRGLDNAGKTTIMSKFCGKDTSIIAPTLGFNIETLEFRGYLIPACGCILIAKHIGIIVLFRYKLTFWDVGGQKSLRSFWRNYFENTDALIWVVDSADRLRMEDCKKELHALLLEEVIWTVCS